MLAALLAFPAVQWLPASWLETLSNRWAAPPQPFLHAELESRVAFFHKGWTEEGPSFQFAVTEYDEVNRAHTTHLLQGPVGSADPAATFLVTPVTTRPPPDQPGPVEAYASSPAAVLNAVAEQAREARLRRQAREFQFGVFPSRFVITELHADLAEPGRRWTRESIAQALRVERSFVMGLEGGDQYLQALSVVMRLRLQVGIAGREIRWDDSLVLALDQDRLRREALRPRRLALAAAHLGVDAASLLLTLIAWMWIMVRLVRSRRSPLVGPRGLRWAAFMSALAVPGWGAAVESDRLGRMGHHYAALTDDGTDLWRQLALGPPERHHDLLIWSDARERFDFQISRMDPLDWSRFAVSMSPEMTVELRRHLHFIHPNNRITEMLEHPLAWLQRGAEDRFARDLAVRVHVHLDAERRLFAVLLEEAPWAQPSMTSNRRFSIEGGVLFPLETRTDRDVALTLLKGIHMLFRPSPTLADTEQKLAAVLDSPAEQVRAWVTLWLVMASMLTAAALLAWLQYLRAIQSALRARLGESARPMEVIVLAALRTEAQTARLSALGEVHLHRARVAQENEATLARQQQLEQRRMRRAEEQRASHTGHAAEEGPSFAEISKQAAELRAAVLADAKIDGELRGEVLGELDQIAAARNARRVWPSRPWQRHGVEPRVSIQARHIHR
ncbi:MAG: hypothetical protein HY904_15510 [Deltaproteobacteria bacterium]|nr:hypothetical protein [Deltaproteobacteria bacterium]